MMWFVGLFLVLVSLSGVSLKAEVTLETHSEWLLQKSARSYVLSPNNQYLDRFGDHPNGGGLGGDLDQTLKFQDWQVRAKTGILLLGPLTASQVDFKELFATWLLGESSNMQVVFGREAYQWGPLEICNVSNPTFRGVVTPEYRDTIDRSPEMARLSWSYDSRKNFNLVGSKYSTFLKWEQTESQHFWGWVLGAGADPAFLGAYAQQSFDDGIFGRALNGVSLYTEVKASRGSTARYANAQGLRLNQGADKDYWSGAFGLRYEIEWDLRFEALHYGWGYKQKDIDAIPGLLFSGNPEHATNFQQLKNNRTDWQRRDYLYLSLRSPELGYKKRTTISARGLYGQSDRSGLIHLGADQKVNRDFSTVLSWTRFFGATDTEYGSFLKDFFAFGLKAFF